MFKNIDNPWLVKTLIGSLTLFGVVAGTALGPLLFVLFNPSTQGNTDAYAQYPAPWYLEGAIAGGIFGFLLALGILVQLARQAALEERQLASGDHAPVAH